MELFEGGIYTRGGVRVKGEKKEKATENTETAEKEESGNEGETCARQHPKGVPFIRRGAKTLTPKTLTLTKPARAGPNPLSHVMGEGRFNPVRNYSGGVRVLRVYSYASNAFQIASSTASSRYITSSLRTRITFSPIDSSQAVRSASYDT